jgi:hypothetical protein
LWVRISPRQGVRTVSRLHNAVTNSELSHDLSKEIMYLKLLKKFIEHIMYVLTYISVIYSVGTLWYIPTYWSIYVAVVDLHFVA